ncbi:MAG: DNA-binding response regulator [Desulfuromonas sp.]|nr:MAG: DNA-binding response regulator [Desulfuromonas sp.]
MSLKENLMPITIVAADPHPIFLLGIAHFLHSVNDMELVAQCDKAADIIPAVKGFKPRVLLTEIDFPEEDSLSTIRSVMDHDPDAKIVVLTSNINDDQTIAALRLGVQGVVLKHMPNRLLAQCIRKVAVGGQWWEKESVGHAIEKMLSREAGARRLATILTDRETEVMCLVAEGLSNREIANRLIVSEGTVKIHVHNIYGKLGINNRVDLTLYAQKKGIV